MTDMLRHTVATLAYRGAKALRGPPTEFASYRAGPHGRSAGEILAHLCDLFDWAITLADGGPAWHDSSPQTWDDDVARFFAGLEAFDGRLAGGVLEVEPERLFQGPIADALTHVGQLAMMRRMAGCPIRGENYFLAGITAGRAGADQPAPVREF